MAAPAMPAAGPVVMSAAAAAAASEAAAETTADAPHGLLIQGFNTAAAAAIPATAAAVQADCRPRVASVATRPVPPPRVVRRSLRVRLAAARVRLTAALGLRTLWAPPACRQERSEERAHCVQ